MSGSMSQSSGLQFSAALNVCKRTFDVKWENDEQLTHHLRVAAQLITDMQFIRVRAADDMTMMMSPTECESGVIRIASTKLQQPDHPWCQVINMPLGQESLARMLGEIQKLEHDSKNVNELLNLVKELNGAVFDIHAGNSAAWRNARAKVEHMMIECSSKFREMYKDQLALLGSKVTQVWTAIASAQKETFTSAALQIIEKCPLPPPSVSQPIVLDSYVTLYRSALVDDVNCLSCAFTASPRRPKRNPTREVNGAMGGPRKKKGGKVSRETRRAHKGSSAGELSGRTAPLKRFLSEQPDALGSQGGVWGVGEGHPHPR